jgi:hypothetical protein
MPFETLLINSFQAATLLHLHRLEIDGMRVFELGDLLNKQLFASSLGFQLRDQ